MNGCQQDTVDDRKDGGVDAITHGERHDGRGCEAGCSAHGPQRIRGVLCDRGVRREPAVRVEKRLDDVETADPGGGFEIQRYLCAAISVTTFHTYWTKGYSDDSASRSTSPCAG